MRLSTITARSFNLSARRTQSRRLARILSLLTIVCLLSGLMPAPATGAAATTPTWQPQHSGQGTPLAFIPNAGQSDRQVRFQAHDRGGSLFFTPREVVLVLPTEDQQGGLLDDRRDRANGRAGGAALRVRYEGTNGAAELRGEGQQAGVVNFLRGADRGRWRKNLPTYAGLTYRDLYAGIDLQFEGSSGQLKGTYLVDAGVDPSRIHWRYQGAQDVQIDPATGDLIITLATRGGPQADTSQSLVERAPVAWQEIGGQRIPVTVRYQVEQNGAVGFTIGSYNTAFPLTIDPTLDYSTFLGGTISGGEIGEEIATDAQGNTYITGYTNSRDFPVTIDAYETAHSGAYDVFVLKLDATGALSYSTFLGGSDFDRGTDIAIGDDGTIYLTGETTSSDFPTTATPYDASHNGATDTFFATLNAAGELTYSTYLGGSSDDSSLGLAIDATGVGTLVGVTSSSDFPISANAFDTSHNGGTDTFVAKLNTTGTLLYGTFLGAAGDDSGSDVALDINGETYLVGSTNSSAFPTTANGYDTSANGVNDAFVAVLNTDNDLVYSTFLGGTSDDYGHHLAVDAESTIYVSGRTLSNTFPTTTGAYDTSHNGSGDVFVATIDAGGTLTYSTFIGGSGSDSAGGIIVDANGLIYLSGDTTSSGFPITSGAYDTSHGGSAADGFLVLFDTATGITYSTFLGGADSDFIRGIALHADSRVALVGWTWSNLFPTTADAIDTSYNGDADAFVTIFNADGTLDYSTFLGGNSATGRDAGQSITVDSDGMVYLTGSTASNDFPTTGDAHSSTRSGGLDAFVLKFDPDGVLLYGTFLGGSADDAGQSIAVADDGTISITGSTNSSDFPTAGAAYDASHNGNYDAFVATLDATGALIYGTYLGGSNSDYGQGIAIGANGTRYLTGYTNSSTFPTTVSGYDPSHNGSNDSFIAIIDSVGALTYSTFLGGSSSDYGRSIAVDSQEAIYITGETSSTAFPTTSGAYDTTYNSAVDAFVVKLTTTNGLSYSSFLGGSSSDYGRSIAVDPDSKAYIVGYTASTSFPATNDAYDGTHNGNYDVFVTKLNAAGALAYSTFLGGSNTDFGQGLALGDNGTIHITGSTSSSTFPTSADAVDTSHNGNEDAFVATLDAAGQLTYGTFLGGSDKDYGRSIALDSQESIYITGETYSSSFPTTSGAFDTTFNGEIDAFLVKLSGDTEAPTTPANLTTTGKTETTIDLAWEASSDDVGVTGYTVTDGAAINLTTSATTLHITDLTPNTTYTFTVTARDAAGNVSDPSTPLQVTTNPDTVAPTVPANVHLEDVTTTSLTIAWDAATDNVGVAGYDIFRDWALVGSTAATNYEVTGLTPDKAYTLAVKARDASENLSAYSTSIRAVTSSAIPLPPDPASVAPDLDVTVATDFADATEFLYTGTDPIQSGVAPGTLAVTRTAVLRGTVLDQNGDPLPGVHISIAGHPEYGSTRTRADGMFDMAVNGGGQIIVNYDHSGYLPSQRAVTTPWNDYVWLPDVVMTPLDPTVTEVVLSGTNPLRVVEGSVVSDVDGARRAILMIPANTTAQMVFADGTTQPLTTLHIRVTEYTVGENGPDAMPGPLPANVAYTYAAEFSVDEALAAGATEVRFSKQVIVYLENFIGFPVGADVPAGYYDRAKAAWVPANSGKIAKIVDDDGIFAYVDFTGEGDPDTPSGWSSSEAQALAARYDVGQELWRVQIDHFTPWDFNWGFAPPDDATGPDGGPLGENDAQDDPCERAGSVIACQNQTLGESMPIVGTPFSLSYSSDRAHGHQADRTLRIPLNGATIHPDLTRVEIEITVAGRRFTDQRTPTPNQTYLFTWDGRDAYGRLVQGTRPVQVRIGHVYRAVYQATSRFGYNGNGTLIDGDRERREFSFWETQHTTLDAFSAREQALGGWDLDVHHTYDRSGQVLHIGEGGRRSAAAQPSIITNWVFSSIGAVNFTSMAIAPDGTAYVAQDNSGIWRKTTECPPQVVCHQTTVVPTGAYDGDGGPASSAHVSSSVNGLAFGPDGSLYIADAGHSRVRRIAPDGIITTVAGTGNSNSPSPSDGTVATTVHITPWDIAVAPDGTLYILELSNSRVLQVTPDGKVSRVAGSQSGSDGFNGDDQPARNALLHFPSAIALAPDGSLYIADTYNHRIRRVGVDGQIATVAGTTSAGFSGDGELATTAKINLPQDVTVGVDGRIIIADWGNSRVRQIDHEGYISTISGTPVDPVGLPIGTMNQWATNVSSVVLGPRQQLFVIGYSQDRIARIQPALPGAGVDSLTIPSEDGSEIYEFDNRGRHLRTLDGLTNVALLDFDYDSAGRLTQVTDRDGRITTIARAGDGTPTAIVSPDGQQTTLALNADGYLESITNPAGETTTFDYTPDGLLTSLTDPRTHTHSFTYDTLGRLTQDANPVGGFTALDRVDFTRGYTVTVSNALNDEEVLASEQLLRGEQRQVRIAPNGATTTTVMQLDGTRVITDTRGVVTTVKVTPDPRWGMQAPYVSQVTMKTPAGTTFYTMSASRSVTTEPTNPLILRTQTDTLTVNGRTTTTAYDATARTITTTDPAGQVTVTTLDPLGRTVQTAVTNFAPTTYSYDSLGRLEQVSVGSGADARSTTFSYDTASRLIATTDPLSGTTQFSYDDANRILTQTLPTGQVLSFSYDDSGNQTSSTDAQGIVTTYEYDAQNRLTAETRDPAGRAVRTEYSYDTADNLLTVIEDAGTGRLNVTTSYAYTPLSSGYGISQVTNALNQATTTTYTPFDAIRSVTDPLGHTTTITYTPEGWPTEVASPGGHTARTTYTTEGLPSSITDPRGSVTTFVYDAAGRLQTETAGTVAVAGAPALNQTRSYTYDVNGRVLSVTDGRGKTSTRAYNVFGELVTETDPLGNTLTFAYDKLGRLTLRTVGANVAGEAQAVAYSYDASGRLLSERLDPNGLNLTTQYFYTADGSSDTWNLQQAIDPRNQRTIYRINSLGLREQVIDPANEVWRFNYDNLGRMYEQIDPLGHSISYAVDALGRVTSETQAGRTTSIAYNADGTIASRTDRMNRVTSFGYDVDARLTSIDYPAGTADVSYSYDAAGNQLTVQDGLGTTSYTYDVLGRMLTRSRDGRTVSYSYNAADQTSAIDYWGQGTVLYGYDDAGRLTSLTPWGASPTSYTYHSSGLLASTTRGNGISTTYGYDSASRLLSLLHAAGSTTIETISYVLDANGNRTQLTDGDGVTSYTYDALDRLTEVQYPAIPSGPAAQTTSYTLDEVGNRLSDGTTSYTYDAGDRITNSGYTYDDNGNLLSDGTTSYSYDGANRLISTVANGITTSYAYDGNGNLIRETIDDGTTITTTDLVLDERRELPLILGEVRSDGTTLRYAYGPEGLSAQQTTTSGTTTIQYPLLDGLGSVRRLTDASGSTLLTRSYDVYGGLRYQSGTALTTLGFAGERRGAIDGLIYLRARHYSPTLGRFLQADTFAGDLRRPQSLNRYSYTGNNPVNRTDPSGHDWEAFTRYSAGVVKGMGRLGATLASLLLPETWEMVGCGLTRLRHNPRLAFEALRQNGINPAWARYSAFARDPGGTMREIASDPERLGEFLGGLAADLTLDVHVGRLHAPRAAETPPARSPLASVCRPNSFDADTPVLTPDGEKPIGEIAVGDEVLAYNEATGEVGVYPVAAVLVHYDPAIVQLTIDQETITTTPEHPFYVEGKGWVDAGALQEGDQVRQADGTTGTVRQVTIVQQPQVMYNLTVADAHTFFVGEEDWLVHNLTCTPGKYEDVGGHHIHAKAAFRGEPNYDLDEALSISQADITTNGWDHQAMTTKQRQLFDQLAISGRPNTMREHNRIAVEALIAGGVDLYQARQLVALSLQNLRMQKVRNPTRIPWN